MKERPIIFNAEMVNAILSSRKTQTRRIINPQPELTVSSGFKWKGALFGAGSNDCETNRNFAHIKCPFGEIGDRLWVRETWARCNIDQYSHDMAYRATTPDDWPKGGRWRQSNHMPRWASRITLEITGMRVERLNSINENDALAEGLSEITKDGRLYKYGIPDRDGYPGNDNCGWPWHEWERYPISAYSKLWQSIYGAESWQANPWVWVLEFKRVDDEA
ncbi:hypothetical protein BS639_22835 [Rouxiella silvae]|uniref:Morphogenetic protein n=1 Tax=Rouxiella silvae TaxID=1646373 RepID=A0ABX3TUL7_9GAMM|nr:hypothetical protein [Rouxiella silvae]ORJ18920.1 hypothetical protein BS639_22835 [Rouxiella silvae]